MTSFAHTGLAAIVLIAASAASAASAQADTPVTFSGYVAAATDSNNKDTSETQTDAQAQLYLQATRGPLYFGAKIKNVSGSDGRDNQQEYYFGALGTKGGFKLGLNAAYKIKAGAKFNDNHYWEWKGEVSHPVGGNVVKLEVEYTPDNSGITAKEAYWANLSVSRKLSDKWGVSAGVGARRTSPSADYNAMDVGVTYAIKPKTSLDLRFFNTDRHAYGEAYGDRVVLKITQGF